MSNAILNPDRTRKNIVSVDEVTARSPECPIDILPEDIFVENVPEIPEGLFLPKLLPDGSGWEEGDPAGKAADDTAKASAIRRQEIITRLQEIDMDSVRALRAQKIGRGSQPDIDKLTALEDEAELLRAELLTL